MFTSEEYEQKFTEQINSFNKVIQKLWHDIGLNSDQLTDRRTEVLTNVKELLDGMYQEEDSLFNRLTETVNLARRDICDITRALKLPAIVEPEGLSLIQLESFLLNKANHLRGLKKERMDKLEKLMKVAKEIAHAVGEPQPYAFNEDDIPSDRQLSDLQSKVEDLMMIKEERLQKATVLKDDIMLLYEVVEEDPKDVTLSRQLLVDSEVTALLTPSTLIDMENLRQFLEEKQEANQNKADSLRQQLRDIYARLDLPLENMDSFLRDLPGCKPSTLRQLEEELERLHELKRQNIEKFVISCRKELESYWDMCYISDNRRYQFKPYVSTTFSESLLTLHENEVSRMKQFHEKAQPLLDVFHQHQDLWTEFVDMEHKANDPSRLLTRNRGGGLLQESKRRKEIERKIPKLEEKLAALVVSWENENSETFNIFDVPILDYINHLKETFLQEKDSLKKAKEEEKQREKENELRFGSKSVKRTAAGGPKATTPMKKCKLGMSSGNVTNMVTTKISGTSTASLPATMKNILPSKNSKMPSSTPRKMTAPIVGPSSRFGMNNKQVQPPPKTGVPLQLIQKSKRKSIAQLRKKQNDVLGPLPNSQPLKTSNSQNQHDMTKVLRRSARLNASKCIALKSKPSDSNPADETQYNEFTEFLHKRSQQDDLIPHSSVIYPK